MLGDAVGELAGELLDVYGQQLIRQGF